MEFSVVMLVLLSAAAASVDAQDPPAESQAIVDFVNAAQTTWTAGRNFRTDFTQSQARRLLGHIMTEGDRVIPHKSIEQFLLDEEIPESFDAREVWKDCPHIGHIRDQSDCGSCWAVTAVSTFTDRLCIASGAAFTDQLSESDLLTCCKQCGDGCNGGNDDKSWLYFQNYGIVTGGDYDSHEGCQPYPLPPCEHHTNGSRIPCPDLGGLPTPQCQRACNNSDYTIPFTKDHHKVQHAYTISSCVKTIQRDIMAHGPVQAAFDVYSDFFSYKSGVYQHVTGELEGAHAGKVIGWGVENGVPYWLAANSFNLDWGDEGFFKILRGNDECQFESWISAGIVEWKTY